MLTLEEQERAAYISGDTVLANALTARAEEYERQIDETRHEASMAGEEANMYQRQVTDLQDELEQVVAKIKELSASL